MTRKQRKVSKSAVSIFVLLTLVMCAAPAFAQTNPCAQSLTTVVVNPSEIAVDAPELGLKIGTSPYLSAVEIGVVLNGASAPTSLASLLPSAFTLATGTTSCYTARLPQPLAVPVGQQHVVAARAVNGVGASAWVTGSPFVVAGAPSALSSVRVR